MLTTWANGTLALLCLLGNVNWKELYAGRKQGCATEKATQRHRPAFRLRSHRSRGGEVLKKF